MVNLVDRVTEQLSGKFPGRAASSWSAPFFTERLRELVDICNAKDGPEERSQAAELRRLFSDEPRRFDALLGCIEAATEGIRERVMQRRQAESLTAYSLDGLAAGDPGVRFTEALRDPRAWQVLVALFLAILCSPLARPNEGSRGRGGFLKLDVCPAAGKTFAATWYVCLARAFGYANSVVCIAGDKDCVKSQWADLLKSILGEKQVRIETFQGLAKVQNANPRAVVLVDEAHHAKVGGAWGESLCQLQDKIASPILLLTGTDVTDNSILNETPCVLRVDYPVALQHGWVRKVHVENLAQKAYVEGATGETLLDREKLYLSVIPQKPDASMEQRDQFKQTLYVQALAHVICVQHREATKLQDNGGKCMVFLKNETDQIRRRLERANWADGMRGLSKAALKEAVEVAGKMLDVQFEAPSFHWAEHLSPGLERFRKERKSRRSQVIFCFAKDQGGEGFDDPQVNAILFLLSAKTELRLLQMVARAVRQNSKQPDRETALVFCVDENNDRYDKICQLFSGSMLAPPQSIQEAPARLVVKPLIENDLPTLPESHEERLPWRMNTSQNYKEGCCGQLPVHPVRDARLLSAFQRMCAYEALEQEITFVSKREPVRCTTEAWMGLRMAFRFPHPPIPVAAEDRVLAQLHAVPAAERYRVRSFASQDTKKTLFAMLKLVRDFFESKLASRAEDGQSVLELAEHTLRETWRHFLHVAEYSPMPSFEYKEVTLGCDRCGLRPSGVSNRAQAPCWCERIHEVGERYLDVWQAVYLPCRIQFFLDDWAAREGAARPGSATVGDPLHQVRLQVRERLSAGLD